MILKAIQRTFAKTHKILCLPKNPKQNSLYIKSNDKSNGNGSKTKTLEIKKKTQKNNVELLYGQSTSI